MNRRITFGARITLNYKPVRGLGLREMLLLAAAAAQAVYCVFLADGIAFAVRLGIALCLALALLAIAVVPVRGYRVEHFIAIVLRGLVRPRRYLHQTAARDMPSVAASDEEVDSTSRLAAPLRRAQVTRVVAREGDWAGPNLALVLALFCALLVVGTLIVYATGARLPEVRW